MRASVLVAAVLYWAQVVLVPVCLAILLTFVLTPAVVWLQRRIGRIAAVLIVVFGFLALAGYGVYRQMVSLGNALPTYRTNIQAKVQDVQMRAGGSVEKFERTFEQLRRDLGTPTHIAYRRGAGAQQTPSSAPTHCCGWRKRTSRKKFSRYVKREWQAARAGLVSTF